MDTTSARLRRIALPGLATLAVAAVYAKVVGYGAIPVWDDGQYLLTRTAVTDWWASSWRTLLLTPELGYPVPVPTFLYAHVRLLFPEQFPHALHALNLGLHLANCLLVYRLVAGWLDRRSGVAAMALWGLHPVGVETVAWLTNLKTLLAATCLLGAMLLWRRHLRGAGGRWHLAGVAALIVVALGCRPDAAIGVPVLALQTIRHGGLADLRRRAAPLVGLLVPAAATVVVAMRGHGAIVQRNALDPQTLHTAAMRVTRTLELSVAHLVWPIELHPGYYFAPNAPWPALLPGLLIAVALLAAGLALARRGRREALFGLALFVVLYLPYSNLRHLPRNAADTYLYLPAFAAILTALAWLRPWTGPTGEADGRDDEPSDAPTRRRRRLATAAVVVLVASFAALTATQLDRWRDAESLWAPVVEAYPDASRPYTLLALSRLRADDWQTARKLADRALPLYRKSRNYPYFLPLIYEQTDAPETALAIARETIAHGHDLGPRHHKVFADVIARRDAPLPDTDPHASAFERALREYHRRDRWLANRRDRLTMANYLTARQRHDDARPFVRRELATDHPHCFTWTALERMPDPPDAPPRPPRCN